MALRMWMPCALASAALVVVLSVTQPAPGQNAVTGPRQVVAVVNGESITLADVDAILKARPLESMKPTPAEYHEMQKEALNMLIDEVIMQQFLSKNAPPVAVAQVNQKFKEFQESLQSQGQTLAEYIRASGQTEAQVRNTIGTTLQWTAFRDSHLNEATLQKYYEDNRDVFDQVTVRVSHLLLRLNPTLTAAQIEEVRNWLLGIRQDIVAGKLSFAEAARKYSQDLSGPKGGDIGEISRKGSVEESFARAAFALKPNEISDVVRTESGMHLIMVTLRNVASPSNFKAMEEKVRTLAGEEMMSAILAQQRQIAQVKISLPDEPIAKTPQTGQRFHFGHQ